ncbi:MAG: diguanylate cyclase [Lysobacteraceae bacterium]
MWQKGWTEDAAQSGVRQGFHQGTTAFGEAGRALHAVPFRWVRSGVHQTCRWVLTSVLLLGVVVDVVFADPVTASADASVVAPPDAVDQALARLTEDRAAALAELEGLASTAGSIQGKAIAKWLDALAEGPERERVVELAKPLLDSPVLSSAQRVEVFASYLAVLAQIKPAPVSEETLIALTKRLMTSATTDEQVSYGSHLAAWQLRNQHFANAEATLDAAITLNAARPASAQRASLLRNLGVALAQQGKLDQALQAMLQADTLTQELGLPADAGLVANLAGLYVYLEDWQHARQYAQRAYDLAPEGSANQLTAVNMLGNSAFGLGEFQTARDHFERGLALATRLGRPGVSERSNLALTLLNLGHPREALARFEEVIRLADASADGILSAVGRKNAAECWIALGDRAKADRLMHEALQIYAKEDVPPKRKELLQLMVDNLEAIGRHAEALQRLREYHALDQEMINSETKARIASLENDYTLKSKDVEIALQRAELQAQQADLERLRGQEQNESLQRKVLLVALLGLAGIVFALWHSLRLKARANRELMAMNCEIEAQRIRLQELNVTIRRQSEEDALTGLHNRRYLQSLLDHTTRAESGPVPASALVIIADLDHFKRVNDTWGHDAGDQVLRHVAETFRSVARAGDSLVRWGGEEFVWWCPGASVSEGPALCARLQAALAAAPVILQGEAQQITASIGFAPVPVWPGSGVDSALGLKLADHATYLAKRAGRNCWFGYAPRRTPDDPASLGQTPVDVLEQTGWVECIAAPG